MEEKDMIKLLIEMPEGKDGEQVAGLMDEYYESIPTGRALGEYRFSLQKSLESINYALSFGSREEMLKEKKRIESKLNEIKKKLEERREEHERIRAMTKKELKALKRENKQSKT